MLKHLDVGDPLTAEELEEKERLLEDVSEWIICYRKDLCWSPFSKLGYWCISGIFFME